MPTAVSRIFGRIKLNDRIFSNSFRMVEMNFLFSSKFKDNKRTSNTRKDMILSRRVPLLMIERSNSIQFGVRKYLIIFLQTNILLKKHNKSVSLSDLSSSRYCSNNLCKSDSIFSNIEELIDE